MTGSSLPTIMRIICSSQAHRFAVVPFSQSELGASEAQLLRQERLLELHRQVLLYFVIIFIPPNVWLDSSRVFCEPSQRSLCQRAYCSAVRMCMPTWRTLWALRQTWLTPGPISTDQTLEEAATGSHHHPTPMEPPSTPGQMEMDQTVENVESVSYFKAIIYRLNALYYIYKKNVFISNYWTKGV